MASHADPSERTVSLRRPAVQPGSLPRSPSEALQPLRGPPAPRRRRPPQQQEPEGGGNSRTFVGFLNGLVTFALFMLIAGYVVLESGTRLFDAPGPLEQTTLVVIPRGEGANAIANRLQAERIVASDLLTGAVLRGAMFWSGSKDLKHGEYEIPKGASIRQVLTILSEGKAILHKVTVAEGMTSLQIVERLNEMAELTGDIGTVPPEGSLMPDTYKFSRGMGRQELLNRMQTQQQRLLKALWDKRAKDLPLKTPEEALILASIIEKETGQKDERDRVAAVFVNRLKRNMRLQSDPTIIYGIVGGKGSLGRGILRSEIDQKTPYNTYQIDGLPPTPICNPGKSAIEAALNPAATGDLYFVANGTGGHVFAATLAEHNKNVRNWRRIEQERNQPAATTPEPASVPPAVEPAPTKPALNAAPQQPATRPATTLPKKPVAKPNP